MQLNEFEEYVRLQVQKSPLIAELSANAFLSFSVAGLNEEAGEVSGLLCREVYKGRTQSKEEWLGELGDTLWYLAAATMAKGLTLEDVVQYNIRKLRDRYDECRELEN